MANKNSKTTAKKTTKSTPVVKTANMNGKTTKTSTAAKVSSRRSTRKEQSVDVYPVESASSTSRPRIFIKRSYVVAVIAAVAVILIVYAVRSLLVAAVVNGQPIPRWQVDGQLEQQYGDQALQSLETEALISQAAGKKNISVSQSEVNDQITTIKKNLSQQGQTLDAALAYQHMTQSQLEDQIKLQKLLDKMVGPVTVTPKQISDYMAQNKSSLPSGTTNAQVKQQLQQQALQTKEQSLIDSLRKQAKITTWVNF